MHYTFKQKFHAVGQGLFYSSSLSSGTSDAHIVFDCGSDKIDFINREVAEYKKEVVEIDLLILSHLHYDHISGLDELLKDMKVKTIILPYLNKYERILLQISYGTKAQWYSDFLDNPYNWLSEKENITNIVVINGNGEQSNDNEEIPFQDFNPDVSFEVKNSLTKNDADKNKIEADESITFNGKISVCHTQGYIQIANLYFKFFNYQIDSTKLNNFKTAINSLGIKDTQSLLNILKDPKQRKNLEKAYEQIEKYDLNKTSLVAYQGLIFSKDRSHIHVEATSSCNSLPIFLKRCCWNHCDYFIHKYFHRHSTHNRYIYDLHCHCENSCKNMMGTLLLGDIKLDYKQTKRKDEFFNYFVNLLKTVQIIQLSHHGANNGWNDKLISEISPSCLYIASHAVKNHYKHPHKEVLITLARNQRHYISVTEYDEWYVEFIYM